MPRKKKLPPFSLRLTPEERERLDTMAAGMPLGAYIKARLFSADGDWRKNIRKSRGNHPVKDHTALAQVLAKLGQSRLASNINQLAKAANSGSLPLTPETESALQLAAREISAMKRMLMTALGIRER